MFKLKYYIRCFLTFILLCIPLVGIVLAYFINGTSILPKEPINKNKQNKFYLEEVWIDGMYNTECPPYLVLRMRVCGIFYKTIIDFGLLTSVEDCKRKYKIANRYCRLLNIRNNYHTRN